MSLFEHREHQEHHCRRWLTGILLVGILSLTLAAKTGKATRARSEVVQMKQIKLNVLNNNEKAVIIDKGTEQAFTGKYYDNYRAGLYLCRQCNAPLYRADDKFKSGCGWPSFDDELPGAIKQLKDADGRRIEILCSKCGAHLGHLFSSENFTPKNSRHCVNSISMRFVDAKSPQYGRAIFGGGCFWGIEYYLQQQPGVIMTTVGYSGGKTEYPIYREVCSGKTGHIEVLEVIFDPQLTDFTKLVKYFFTIHNPTQLNRQGPDIGEQYSSVIFYANEAQRKAAEKIIADLKRTGIKVVTKVIAFTRFWPAEAYHQNYYRQKGGVPYCHGPVKKQK
jgi:peptide methionine sulfoxide reductase msrA/msrB